MSAPLTEHPLKNTGTLTETKPPGNCRGILFIMLAAVAVRLAVFVAGIDKGLFYPDEHEYLELAKNIANGEGFSYKGEPTSFRPPGFAFLMSVVLRLFDTTSPMPLRALQMLLSLLTVWIIYLISRDGWGERTGLVAAGIFAFYPSLLGFNNILLTEPGFMLCISLACWAMVRHLKAPGAWWSGGAGAALGLGALIRDTLLYSGPVTALFLTALAIKERRYGLAHAASFIGGFLAAILPWCIRNSLLHGETAMISTVGGVTFYLCNNEDAPMIRTPSIFFERPINQNEGYYYETLLPELDGLSEPAKQNAAVRKGLEYMLANPGATFLRMLGRLVDFWGQERLVVNQFLAKYYGDLPVVASLLVIAAVFGVYSTVIVGAVFGYFCTRLRPFDIFSLWFMAYYTMMHLLVFAHPRYHIHLLPFLIIAAARAFLARSEIWANRRSWRFIGAAMVSGIFAVIWIIGVFVFDADKIANFLR
jgi:4-amino-4-deoxy-L-arabinose transferase-like glycosyltransferase